MTMTIRPARLADHLAIIALLTKQLMRQHRTSAVPLCLHSLQEVTELVKWQCAQRTPLVAINDQGAIRGYVLPELWVLSDNSLLHAFLTARNGIASTLTLPEPDEPDAQEVTEALMQALTSHWRQQSTTGDLIRWPSSDMWLGPILEAHGFLVDSVCAFHPPTHMHSVDRTVQPSWYEIRDARPTDEEAIVALFQEELIFQADLGLFARSSSAILEAFRAKLAHSFSAAGEPEDRPLFLIAETTDGIVAMAECKRIIVNADDEPGFTPPGIYGCIDNISVSTNFRGRGIGRVLTQMAMHRLQPGARDGYLLWYSVDNPLAARFWVRGGFLDQWTTYQRLQGKAQY